MRRRGVHEIQGYSRAGREVLENVDLTEAKETMDVCTAENTGKLPDVERPNLRPALLALSTEVSALARRLLTCLALDLGTPQQSFFDEHSKMFSGQGNASAIRLLHYPGIESVDTKARITRCGVHTDYGGLTLLFQVKKMSLNMK